MMRSLPSLATVIMTVCVMTGCAGPSAPSPEPAPPPVKDDSGKLPLAGRVSTSVVPNHLFGQKKMPGATVGEYESAGKKYQLFIIETDSAQSAAFLLVDMKNTFNGPEYLPNMGGYFGTDGTRPIFVFAKLQYLAGVAGLSKNEADPIARQLAARLR